MPPRYQLTLTRYQLGGKEWKSDVVGDGLVSYPYPYPYPYP